VSLFDFPGVRLRGLLIESETTSVSAYDVVVDKTIKRNMYMVGSKEM